MLKAGIIGCGSIATGSHEKALLGAESVKLAAVSDIRRDAADEMAKRNGAAAYYDYRELLASDVDIVIVCTPPDLHVEMGVAAAEAKKHLFMEKPVALSYGDALKLKNAVDKNGIRCQCGYVVGYMGVTDTLRRVYKSGALGKLVSIFDARIGNSDLPRKDVGTYRDWLVQKARSGGVMVECFTHEVAWMVSVGGRVDSVYAKLQATETDPRIDIDDNHWAILNFADGGIATFGGSWANPASSYGKSVMGQEAAVMTGEDNKVIVKRRFEEKEEIIDAEPDADTTNKIEDFARRIKDGKPNRNTIDEAVYNIKVMMAMHKSSELNTVVKVDSIV